MYNAPTPAISIHIYTKAHLAIHQLHRRVVVRDRAKSISAARIAIFPNL